MCTGYRSKGEDWDHPMANISHLKHAEPDYVELPGWKASTRECRRFEDLPTPAQDYIEAVAEVCGAPVDIISVGPDREQTITRSPLF